ncbi:extracellular catalytic domain type 1 short-chain-length polyhydroxyalkanoate depolymerase [Cupriavidus plantarum]|uniref:Poly(Hydroxyalkanoate) depolymerase family esterase n=1 Tax=Cupriavidus plantarum TaxID=942865 RepID=A0A316F1L6_9BURK|nr:PHB depolymerase family esterase [Cupriavidus plantarum]PWK37413.1 poly(hydroxyalkanoate) depolymerase family esterase [Cupriavidus plantarum]
MKMNDAFLASMHDAMRALRSAGPAEATAIIQRALMPSSQPGGMRAERDDLERDELERDDLSAPMPAQVVQHLLTDDTVKRPKPAGAVAKPAVEPTVAPILEPTVEPTAGEPLTASGRFTSHSFANQAGQREYKLYMPAKPASAPMPLVVMLHGCTQDADDFAAGTRMNALADELGFAVAYPIQGANANPSKCWNWFRPGDQQADRGEPAILAGITREVLATQPIDPRRIYIAGLSAGGAMAAIMIDRYPDLYAAAGIHSGLPAGAAHDLPSALGAMKGGTGLGISKRGTTAPVRPQRPMIVFHGDADPTVHPSNGGRLIEPYEQGPEQRQTTRDTGRNTARNTTRPGRAYTRHQITPPSGIAAEYWILHGAGHAWSGGSRAGSYTDPKGPDASREMVRFFLAHPKS